MEDGHRPSVEQQRRLNPIMKEVTKKEVIKWLNAGIIFPSSDSNLVSPMQCVPKKGGMTVVENEKNELIPTRTMTGWRVYIDYRRLNKATNKDHFPLLFIDQILDRLAGHEYYYFLDGYSGYNQIVIALDVTRKEFDEIRDQKGTKNEVADHLSWLENHEHVEEGGQINETFPDEQLFYITHDPAPWYADYVNYLVSGVLPPEIQSEAKKRFLHDVNFYYWDELFLYRQCADQLIRKCIPEKKVEQVLYDSYASPYGGHHGGDRTTTKLLQ
uniref:RNA-directed DNA polymerase homolog n=1 Tax=Nicotiana tabacum TaxID=4097 RepID=A0A1S3YXL4_TOBAC|nr:PREDICTED: uncharacterized protein LOC107780800 [Nicotiana tabacum]